MLLCGIDEVGRGPLAGPLVACATILNSQNPIFNLKDSKKLSAAQRAKLYTKIKKSGAVIAISVISVNLINKKGIGWANKEAFRRLMRVTPADKYIIDGNLKIAGATSIIKADAKYPEVMAASIIAKVWRDRLMARLHQMYPQYGWISNKGYGTKYHIQALREHGPTKHHRKLFVKTALKPHPKPLSLPVRQAGLL